MANKKIIAEWQKRLEDTFSYGDIVGGRHLLPVMKLEDAVGEVFIGKYHGHRILTDCFLDFFAETLTIQADFNGKYGWLKQAHYATCLMMFLTVFRTTRAAELLSVQSYPMQGYAAMRSVKDQVWTLCAAANHLATFANLFGWDGVTPEKRSEEDTRRIVSNRRKVEQRIRELIIGDESGLSENTRVWLLKWERMFNWEAHRGLYSLFRAHSQLDDPDSRGFSLVAFPDEILDAMFINRSTEINWMILRLLPFVRREETHSEEWARKWVILDESFAFMINGLSEMGKPIGPAFVELVSAKFKFDPSVYYAEAGMSVQAAPATTDSTN